MFGKLFGIFLAITIAIGAVLFSCCCKSPADGTLIAAELEKLRWDNGKSDISDTTIRPFKIKFAEEAIKDLKSRLEKVRLTEPLQDIQQQYGMNTNLLKDIINYWKNNYNFVEREKYLNKHPQFKTKIQGLDIHYIHVKPKDYGDKQVLPLLLLHGWPGSVREFYDIIPLLTTKRQNYDFVFELIIPSLPGYGFSDGSSKPGYGPAQMAVTFKLFMERLGFQKFYAQGGDYGAVIIQTMAKMYPDSFLGLHLNLCIVTTGLSFMKDLLINFYPSALIPEGFREKSYLLSTRYSNRLRESGYFHITLELLTSPIAAIYSVVHRFLVFFEYWFIGNSIRYSRKN